MKKYLIEITESNGEVSTLELETDRLDWSMEQYQRNRNPFTWKVVAEIQEWTNKSDVSAKIINSCERFPPIGPVSAAIGIADKSNLLNVFR